MPQVKILKPCTLGSVVGEVVQVPDKGANADLLDTLRRKGSIEVDGAAVVKAAGPGDQAHAAHVHDLHCQVECLTHERDYWKAEAVTRGADPDSYKPPEGAGDAKPDAGVAAPAAAEAEPAAETPPAEDAPAEAAVEPFHPHGGRRRNR